MRLLLGIALGIVITFGAAYIHDTSVPPDPVSSFQTERQIVNWDVLADAVRNAGGRARDFWNRNFGNG